MLDRTLKAVVLQRVSVFLKNNEGTFSGVLTQTTKKMYTFEQCKSVPTKDGETAVPFKGRVLLPIENVLYLVDDQ